MRRLIFLGSLFLLVSGASAQVQPNAAEILDKISATYKNASEYELLVDTTSSEPDDPLKTVSGHAHIAFRMPDRYMIEGALPGMASGGGLDFSGAKMTYDGTGVWAYLPKPNKYAFIPTAALSGGQGDIGDLKPEAMDYYLMNRYRNAPNFGKGAAVVRQELVDFSGAKRKCYVLAIPNSGGYTWWVDAENNFILREDSPQSSTVYTTVRLTGSLSDDLFKFDPPPGATRLGSN